MTDDEPKPVFDLLHGGGGLLELCHRQFRLQQEEHCQGCVCQGGKRAVALGLRADGEGVGCCGHLRLQGVTPPGDERGGIR